MVARIAGTCGFLCIGTAVALGQAGMPALPKQVSATPPVTTCSLQSANHTGVLGLVYNSETATIAYWTDFTITCGFSGGIQTLTLPPGTDHDPLGVTALGASGGKITFGPNAPDHSYDYTLGGKGAQVTTSLNLGPGTALQLRVGGMGQDGVQVIGGDPAGVGGWNGGGSGGQAGGAGGGGATDVRVAPFADANRLVVAGGGGGAGMYYAANKNASGGAGGQNGSDGLPGVLDADYSDTTHTAGYGATQSAAGAAGAADKYYYPSYTGSGGAGSAGGTAAQYGKGGGGAAGWFGGGSGEGSTLAGGGGGSSNVVNGSGTQYVSGVQSGNGQLVLHYRVYTFKTACLNMSTKAIARGQTEPVCAQVPGS